MTEDLLAREKEFYRLNKELDKKTRELLQEVDYVMGPKNNSYLSSLSQHYSIPMLEDINEKLLDAPTLMERQSEPMHLKKKNSLPNFSDQFQLSKE